MDCIGIIGAMEEEVAALKEKMEQVEVTKKASMEFYRGVLEGKKAVWKNLYGGKSFHLYH